jgi:peptide/nickel transport system permease protein
VVEPALLAPERRAPASETARAPAFSASPWNRALERMRRRRGARWAARALFVLCGAAIFAPLIATELPLRAVAVDYGRYATLLSELPTIVGRIDANADPRARSVELAALERRLRELESQLAPADRAALEELAIACRNAPDWPQLRVETSDVRRDMAVALATSHAPRNPATGSQQGVVLLPRTTWPALRALSSLDVALMALWVVLAVAFVVPCRWRRRALLAAPALAVVAGIAAWIALPASAGPPSPSKQALTRGEAVAASVWFAPIAMGAAETHPSEAYRPPTWLASSAIGDDGRYVHRGALETVQGLEPPAMPVEVLRGEPERNAPLRHAFGTDGLGRDVLARVLHGARVSLLVGAISAAVLLALGLFLGALAGFFGGWVDAAILRAIEVLSSFPAFFLILCAAALLPERALHPVAAIVLAIALVSWTSVARLVRAEILSLRERDFLLAARALGLEPWRILWKHALPNALAPALVAAPFAVSSAILLEAAVSFLGFGVRVPVPSWGGLLAEAQGGDHAWIALFPGLALFATLVCTNVLGEALRSALDPREGGP